MNRIIRASEVKPGMEVEFTFTRRMTIHKVIMWGDSYRELRDDAGHVERMDVDAPVTVVSEPQPEEPTEFGARVAVAGRRFLLAPEGESDYCPWLEEVKGIWHDWDGLCEMGPVTVVPDQGWTVPDTTEVPERIEEWPENDTALRAYPWRDTLGIVWRYGVTGGEPGWSCGSGRAWKGLIYGPFTRVTDA